MGHVSFFTLDFIAVQVIARNRGRKNRTRDPPASDEAASCRSCRNSQSLRLFDQKRTLGFFLEHKTKTATAAMLHAESRHLQVFFANYHAGFEFDVFDSNVNLFAAQDDLHQIPHAVECPAPAINLEVPDRFPATKGRSEPAD